MQTRRRPGRPARQLLAGERVPMSHRVRPELKQKMDRAAAENGRSVAQEIELRLEQSFRSEALRDQVLELAFGRIDGDLMYFLGKILQVATHQARTFFDAEHWCDDGSAFKATENYMLSVLDELRPVSVANQQLTKTIERFMRREILREFAGENWLAGRFDGLGFRAILIENWLKKQQLHLVKDASELPDITALTKHITVLDDQSTESSEEGKK
jgi:hypothetical protein